MKSLLLISASILLSIEAYAASPTNTPAVPAPDKAVLTSQDLHHLYEQSRPDLNHALLRVQHAQRIIEIMADPEHKEWFATLTTVEAIAEALQLIRDRRQANLIGLQMLFDKVLKGITPDHHQLPSKMTRYSEVYKLVQPNKPPEAQIDLTAFYIPVINFTIKVDGAILARLEEMYEKASKNK